MVQQADEEFLDQIRQQQQAAEAEAGGIGTTEGSVDEASPVPDEETPDSNNNDNGMIIISGFSSSLCCIIVVILFAAFFRKGM